MKRIISLAIICIICNVMTAHTIGNDPVNIRHWSIEKEHKYVDGSFYMFKDGKVFIEDINYKVEGYPLLSLSDEDQVFALNKNEWVKEINKRIIVPSKEEATPLFDFNFWMMIAALFLFGVYLFSFSNKRTIRYLLPVFAIGAVFTLYSFTGKVIKHLQSTITNPLTIDSAFTPFKPGVTTNWDTTWFYVSSCHNPSHPMMAGITAWQQQVPIPQTYTGNNSWQIPLNPVLADTPVAVSPAHFTRGAVAVAINGIPIFNPYTNTGADAFLTGQLDNWGGHCGRADDYHYHIAPMTLYNQTASNNAIAYALDGFAVYGTVEPDGSARMALDTNNGHFWHNVYHYHGVPSAPYMIGYMVGKVTEDTTHQIIPQPHANPVRGGQTPLNGAVITNCQPNGNNNGYNLSYTLNSNTDSLVYSWTNTGVYTFKFYRSVYSDSVYNGFLPCVHDVGMNELAAMDNAVLIYPNPSQKGFTLGLKNNIEKEIQEIAIYSINGYKVYHANKYNGDVDISSLSVGTYLVKIQFRDYQVVKKLLVQ